MSLSVKKCRPHVKSDCRERVRKHELEIFKRLCRSIDTPRSLACYMLVCNHEFEQYLQLKINPDLYNSAEAFADDYLVSEALKKSVSQETSFDKEQVAFQKWVDAEQQCAVTNERLAQINETGVFPEGPTGSILRLATRFCQKALGSLTYRTLSQIERSMDFGPGSTLSVSGNVITRGRKFTNPTLTTTSALVDFGVFCLPEAWRRHVSGFKIEDANKLTFVPKNAKTHRAITIEADLNIFVQKGIGQVLRGKLRNLGINLEDQWSYHHQLVKRAASEGLSTVDLSSASDTICYEAVKMFCSEAWFDLLSWARPEKTVYKGVVYNLEKFSGMGNGFTFELETLIFYSLLYAAREYCGCTQVVSAFGDDMICSNEVHRYLVDALGFLGFSVNVDKTFGKGRFHESCGCDCFDSTAVRPIYFRFKDFDHEEKFALYQYCNLIRRYAHNRCSGMGCDARFLPAWLYCTTSLRPDDRHFVAGWDYADCGIVGNFDESAPSLREHDEWRKAAIRRGFSGYRFTVSRRGAVNTQRYTTGAYVSALKASSDWTHGVEALRGRTKPAVTRTAYVLHWPYLGPWI